ncbi:glycosyltransferase [Thalassobius vesicularis]|uniref:Glycosyltransferase n=1 Tax=Thalassobius vesicularis TaxID=1294297 RepID=A0A4S3MF36_9RHOB|nr:glycosyltransferase [Thalassobius vesicularis]THD76906.1 glycosyltransferase [Thalassobius vesicularis]
MQQLPVSVVVVSRGRPDSLRLCLTGLARLHYRNFEIIVVADPSGIDAARALPFSYDFRLISYDEPNISAARNIGISAAAGEVVAFIDDDAVPEPTWLNHLIAPFDDPDVAAAGGFVIGRNGISWQWTARSVGPDGEATPLTVDPVRPTILTPPPGHAIKTEGTNMAVRRWVLKKLGGFDEGFRFYLDETDLNMRLARGGYATAIVPLAVVHHAYAAGPRRAANRAVKDLSDIGRSSAVFWRKHLPHAARAAAEAALISAQRRRVLQQMRDGLLEPRDVRNALRSLRAGLEDGRTTPLIPSAQIARRQDGFRRFPSLATRPPVNLVGGPFGSAALQAQAAELAQQGHTVTLYLLSATALYHHVRFQPEGYWLQTGGIFGRSLRDGAVFQLSTRKKRSEKERLRVARVRESHLNSERGGAKG